MKWFEARCNRHCKVVHSPAAAPLYQWLVLHHPWCPPVKSLTIQMLMVIGSSPCLIHPMSMIFTTFWFGNPFKSYRKVLYICAVRIFCAVRKYNDTKQREVEEQYTWWPERRKTPMVHQTSCCLTPWFLVIDIRVITVHYCNCNPT